MKKIGAVLLFAGISLVTSCDVKKKAVVNQTNKTDMKNDFIVGKYWKLTMLMGDVVTVDSQKEAHLILKEDGTFIGNGGCNAISGTYLLKELDGISFSKVTSTEKLCKSMKTEETLVHALEGANSFLLKGDTLFLHKGRMIPLAKFEAVYIR